MRSGLIKAAAHITGGGLLENIPRVLPEEIRAELDMSKWAVPEIFRWLMRIGKLEIKDVLRTFNVGIGMVLVVNKEDAQDCCKKLGDLGEKAMVIGQVTTNKQKKDKVEICNTMQLTDG
eukprot:TRINITY_DN2287_c0_g1_i1.p1 TRINITY_DN2287_c0_g1~~TRINITY_DN2287_c0_g1_i1.p1  ORF type:complete len:119 (-),score=21.90 TRINITY_DN2287_c0_g1_i1:76-432(-)